MRRAELALEPWLRRAPLGGRLRRSQGEDPGRGLWAAGARAENLGLGLGGSGFRGFDSGICLNSLCAVSASFEAKPAPPHQFLNLVCFSLFVFGGGRKRPCFYFAQKEQKGIA